MLMLQGLRPGVRQTKRRLRAILRGLDLRKISEARFREILLNLGFRTGAVIMVHSSMDAIALRAPWITPTRLITILQELLGPSGTLLMPTFPFDGLQADYAAKNSLYDVRRTPSRVGLVTEIFRRSAGVRRSLHPTHPVAAWGKYAESLLDTHHIGTAFGKMSPFCKMRPLNGKVVGIGVNPYCFTLLHVAEELHPDSYQHQYESEPRSMTIVDGDRKMPYQLYALRADRVRDYNNAIALLESKGVLRHERMSGLEVCSTDADAFIDCGLRLIDEGVYGV